MADRYGEEQTTKFKYLTIGGADGRVSPEMHKTVQKTYLGAFAASTIGYIASKLLKHLCPSKLQKHCVSNIL